MTGGVLLAKVYFAQVTKVKNQKEYVEAVTCGLTRGATFPIKI